MRGEGRNPHPLVVQTDMAIQTSAQMRAHVFCRDREQRFHERGEDTFFRYSYRDSERFRLLAMLRKAAPVLESPSAAVYVVSSVDEGTIEQLGYFAVSLFWESSIHSWNDGTRPAPSIPLGPYQERLRQFLLDEEPFPNDAALVIEASDKSNRLIRTFGTQPFLERSAFFLPSRARNASAREWTRVSPLF